MSDYYKEILKLQRANPNARAAVNQWLQENIDADLVSLQCVALDTEGELIKSFFGEEWDGDEDIRDDQIHSTKQEIYKLLVPIATLAMPNRLSVDEVTEDPECDAEDEDDYEDEDEDEDPKSNRYEQPRQRNSPRPDPRLNAIATLLNNNLTEDRVRFIVKDELARILNKAIK